MQKQYGWQIRQIQKLNHIPAQPELPSVVYNQPSIWIMNHGLKLLAR
jgi:hypothetical protein